MLEHLAERLVVRLSHDGDEVHAQRERRAVLAEVMRTASPTWRRFLERDAHRVQRGGVPALLALAEAEPASSEIGAAARAYVAQHPVARPSLVAATRSARDACVRTLEPLPRVMLECAHLAPGETVAYAGGDGALHRFDLVTGEVRSGEPIDGANPRGLVATPGAGPIITVSDDGAIHHWDREKLTAKKGGTVRGDFIGLALSPDGKQLAIATDSGLQLGDRTGRGLRTVIRNGCTSAPAFDATGAHVAVVVFDGAVRIADVASGKAGRTLAMASRIEALRFHPDGRLFASSEDGLEVWDAKRGRRIAALTFPRGGTRAVSGVDHIAISADGRTVITGGASDDLVVWDLERGAARGALVTGTIDAIGMVLLPDGQVATFEHDAARVWDVTELDAKPARRRPILGIAFVDDTRIVVSDLDEVRIHGVMDLAELRVDGPTLRTIGDRVGVVASRDGRHVATWAGDDLVVRDTASLAETWRFTTRPDAEDEEYDEDNYEDRAIRATSFVGPHLAFATAHESKVRVVRVDGTPVVTLRGHREAPDELLVAANGTLVSRAGADVIAWKLDDGAGAIAQRRAINAVIADGVAATAVSPDALRFAIEGTMGSVITELATGKATRKRSELPLQGTALVYTPDGRTLVGLVGGDLVIRNAKTGEAIASTSGLDARELRMLPDGKRILTWSEDQLALHDIVTGAELARWIAAASIHDLAVSPSGSLVAIATSVGGLELVRWHDGPPALVVHVEPPLAPDAVVWDDVDAEIEAMFAADMTGLPEDRVERVRALLARADKEVGTQEEEYLEAATALVGELHGAVSADLHAELQRELGCSLLLGSDGKRAKKAVALLRQAAEAGNVEAMYKLGIELFFGDHVKAKPKEGLAYLERAAAREHPQSLHFVGMEYFEQPNTRERARAMVTRAAELGVPWSRTRLADWAVEGTFGPKDPQRAFALYMEVADQEEGAAAGLAILYKRGLGVPKDAKLAQEWYDRAKAAGHEWDDDDRW